LSNLEIEESFDTTASPAEVFAFLLDPEKLVRCLPGAELEAIEDERVFRGRVKVKLGAVAIGYQGRIELTEVDEEAGTLHAEGEGRERGGAGRVRLSLAGRVEPEGSGSRVSVRARVKLAGKIVRLGRGLVEAVAQELFAQFAESVREGVEADAEAGSEPEPDRPLRALPLLLRSLWNWLGRFFRTPS